jgi:hypothetical protein
MRPAHLKEYLTLSIRDKFSVLVKGKPGIGKSDIIIEAAKDAGAELIIEHPVVSDPTDFKGLPFASTLNEIKEGEGYPTNKTVADFLPFKNLRKIIEADKPTVYFLDDLGQAPVSVQAAVMQLLLARQIGEHKVSDHVTFLAATNRKEDKAGVTGLLEPVKSRFRGGIIELDVDVDDWVKWALTQDNIPLELVAFARFKREKIFDAVPTKDIINTASPRTVASVGMRQHAGLPEYLETEVFTGIAGQSFAVEYKAFLTMMRELPSIDEIILNPNNAPVPQKKPGVMYALGAALASRMTKQNIEPIITYTNRIAPENQLAIMKDANVRNREIAETKAFINWAVDKQDLLL